MARLQKYNGKGKDEGKAFYRIQPYLPCGRRVTIRLGTGQKRAEKAVKAIEDLIESSKENVDLNASTKAWIEQADAKLLASLHGFELINAESIAKSESWTLEKLTRRTTFDFAERPKRAERLKRGNDRATICLGNSARTARSRLYHGRTDASSSDG